MHSLTYARLLLVVGAPRSGTTWLGKILDSHPHVVYRHEPNSTCLSVAVQVCGARLGQFVLNPSLNGSTEFSGVERYCQVSRDPKKTSQKWRNELTPEEIYLVSRVAEQLPAGRLFMKGWPTV
jgi:hypothetical protein